MSSLSTSLNIAIHAVLTQQGAISATTNNIANVNTPGYARERVVLSEGAPHLEGSVAYGGGVVLSGIESVRDQLLELRIQEETASKGSADARSSALQQVESIFSNLDQGIGSALDSLFAQISGLSASPSSTAQRQSVLSAAASVVSAIHDTDSRVSQINTNVDLNVVQSVNDINGVIEQIAEVNGRVAKARLGGEDASTLLDQFGALSNKLSELIGTRTISTEQGFTLTTNDGTPLVVGSHANPLTLELGSDGVHHILSGESDITGKVSGGKLGGLLEIRDTEIPELRTQLDSLAYDFAKSMNAAHKSGIDLNGIVGGDMFASSNEVVGAAANLKLLIDDPAKLAVSSDGEKGSSGNVAALLAVQTKKLTSGKSANESYAAIVFAVGSMSRQAQGQATAGELAVDQLANQRAALSSVSIDEESTNLIRYQRAFEAAARVINVVDELTKSLLSMGS